MSAKFTYSPLSLRHVHKLTKHTHTQRDRAFIDSRTPASSRRRRRRQRLNTKIQFKASFPFRVESFSGWAALRLSFSLSHSPSLLSLSLCLSLSFSAFFVGKGGARYRDSFFFFFFFALLYLHLQYAIALLDARFLSGAVLQHCTNMLQGGV